MKKTYIRPESTALALTVKSSLMATSQVRIDSQIEHSDNWSNRNGWDNDIWDNNLWGTGTADE